MTSNVGNSSLYEAGDQRNVSRAEAEEQDRYNEGKSNAHASLDSKDQRSIANKLAAETKKDKEEKKYGEEDGFETKIIKEDPTKLARIHGNEPSKGAKIDKELADEDEAILRKKDAQGKH